jgi:hypothetical protein
MFLAKIARSRQLQLSRTGRQRRAVSTAYTGTPLSTAYTSALQTGELFRTGSELASREWLDREESGEVGSGGFRESGGTLTLI